MKNAGGVSGRSTTVQRTFNDRSGPVPGFLLPWLRRYQPARKNAPMARWCWQNPSPARLKRKFRKNPSPQYYLGQGVEKKRHPPVRLTDGLLLRKFRPCPATLQKFCRACALPGHLHSAVGHSVTVTKLAVFGVSVKRMYAGQHGQDPGQAKRTRFPDKLVYGQFDGQHTPNWTMPRWWFA